MNAQTTYAERLRSAITEAGTSPRAVADNLKISTQAVYKVLRGETMRLQVSHHLKAARILGVDPTWLSEGVGTRHPKGPVALRDNPDYPTVPLVNITFREEDQGHIVTQIDGPASRLIVMPSGWFQTHDIDPGKVIATPVRGSAMEPTLFQGDIVILNLAAKSPMSGEVYMLRLDDQPVLARLFAEGSTWWAHFDNPDTRRHPRRQVDPETAIVGRAVHRQSDRL